MKTNGFVERTIIPDGAPSEFGDIQYHGTDGVAFDETMAMNSSALIGGATAITYGAKIVDPDQSSQPAQKNTDSATGQDGQPAAD